MIKYALNKLLMLIPLLFVVLAVVFLMVRLVPGDPVRVILGEYLTADALEFERARLGLDQPLTTQFAVYVNNVLHGDLGTSIKSRTPVLEEIVSVFPTTLTIAVAATAFSGIAGIALGIIAAVRHNKLADNAIMVLSLITVSTPSFFLALLFLIIFCVNLKLFPSFGTATPLHFVLPVLTLGMRELGSIARTTRSAMLDVLGQDYIRTSKAKGMPRGAVIYVHALRNAIIPVIISLGLRFGSLLAGAALVETVFSIRGIGTLVVEAVTYLDYPRLQGCVLVIASVFLIVNTAVDILTAFVDPRIKLE